MKIERDFYISEYKEQRELIKLAQLKLLEIKNILAINCLHESEFIQNYEWEHDDGYGSQKLLNGSKCCICGKIDWWHQKEFFKK